MIFAAMLASAAGTIIMSPKNPGTTAPDQVTGITEKVVEG
jgi:hypothetical protein